MGVVQNSQVEFVKNEDLPPLFSVVFPVLDIDGTIELLKKHRLMVEDVNISNGGELLRKSFIKKFHF